MRSSRTNNAEQMNGENKLYNETSVGETFLVNCSVYEPLSVCITSVKQSLSTECARAHINFYFDFLIVHYGTSQSN